MRELGRTQEIAKHTKASFQISLKLAQHDESNADWQRDLAMACEAMADLHDSCGEADKALIMMERSGTISARLSAADPSNLQLRHDLAISHHRLADLLERMSRSADALAHRRAGEKIDRELGAKE
jgi:hypothetical protein